VRKIFYLIKPFIPRSLQISVRRFLIKGKIARFSNIWPIFPGSEKKPEGWIGWKYEKKFALVLTHDVEHKKGYDKVIDLMNLEKDYGFKSSFNFVPERDYIVEKSLLQKLQENGFEYGVHGLYHDGKLFSSEKEFLQRAKKINNYLEDWGAVGFRAPAMHHNLDLIGELDILYDLSTFDTDPFEPQPDGVGTIFPFWFNSTRHKNGRYLELPYTIPQDFTTFILLKEKNLKLWKEKLDWIAQNNGMVLVNVHPDYINFHNEKSIEEFPVHLYKDFLNYIKTNYTNDYWNALPVEIARFWESNFGSRS